MARAPSAMQQQYDYGSPRNYYYEDTEGYLGDDYSETDVQTDSGPVSPMHLMPPPTQHRPNITELYRRKNQNIAPTQKRVHQNVYVAPEYYFDHVGAPRMTTTPVYRKCLIQRPPPPRYYKDEELVYQRTAPVYQSLPYVATVPRTSVVQKIPSASLLRPKQLIRKHPVTVRTPRYIRGPMPTSVYKRPSTLCMPLACQPDPARYSKPRKVPTSEVPYQQDVLVNQKSLVRRHSVSAPIAPSHIRMRKGDSKKSLQVTQSRLDSILERYEKIFSKTPEAKFNNMVEDQQLLKPRLPPCLKEKQIKVNQPKPPQAETNINKEKIPELVKKVDTLQVEEVSPDVLEELLAELTDQGFHNIIDEEDKKKIFDAKQNIRPKSPEKRFAVDGDLNMLTKDSQIEIPVKDLPKSFNYQEIKDSISKSTNIHEYISESDDGRSQKNVIKSPVAQSTCSKISKAPSKLSAQEALELHRTKSYVVNLIDTALSNHFGTSISEKSSTKYNLDAKSAVEMLKKQSSVMMEKDLRSGITHVLNDTFSSNRKPFSQCSCKSVSICGKDDATFMKQLRQMRWGHLKHIQREVRRLEDLERFLDSCNIKTDDDLKL